MGRKDSVSLGSHSVAREALDFYEDLRLCPFVKMVGFGRFVPSRKSSPEYRINTCDRSRGFYKLVVNVRKYRQIFNVTVDPRRALMFERFVGLYGV